MFSLIERVENITVDTKTRESLLRTYLSDVYLKDEFEDLKIPPVKKALPPPDISSKIAEELDQQQADIRMIFERRKMGLLELPTVIPGGKSASEYAEERIKAYGLFAGGNSEMSHNLNREFDSIEQRALDLLKHRMRRVSAADQEVETKIKSKASKQFIVSTNKKSVRASDRLALSKSEAKIAIAKKPKKEFGIEPLPILKDHILDEPKLVGKMDAPSKVKNSFEKSFTAPWPLDSSSHTPLQRKATRQPNDSAFLVDDTLHLDSSRLGRNQTTNEQTVGSGGQNSKNKMMTRSKAAGVRHGSVLQSQIPQFIKPSIAKVTRRNRQPTEFEKAFLRK